MIDLNFVFIFILSLSQGWSIFKIIKLDKKATALNTKIDEAKWRADENKDNINFWRTKDDKIGSNKS